MATCPDDKPIATKYSLLVSNTSFLVDVIKQSPKTIGLKLFASDIFSEDDRDFILSDASNADKARQIVTVVTDRTKLNSEQFQKFVTILKEAGGWAKEAVNKLTATRAISEPKQQPDIQITSETQSSPSTESGNLFELIDTRTPLTTTFLSRRDLAFETRKLRGKFAGLVVNVKKCMETKNITMDEIIFFLQHIQCFEAVSVTAEAPLFTERQVEEMKKNCYTILDVFNYLEGYYSWFNYQLIEDLIDAFCKKDEDIEDRLMQYKSSMEEYCNNRLCEVPELNGFGKPRKGLIKPRVFKIDKGWNDLRIKEISAITAIISETLHLKKIALYLRTARNGCVELTYDFPVSAIEELSREQLDKLKESGIQLVEHIKLRRSLESGYISAESSPVSVRRSCGSQYSDIIEDEVLN